MMLDPLARQAFGVAVRFDKLEQKRVLDRLGAEIHESEETP